MNGLGLAVSEIEAACAICGAAPYPRECPHEGQRLELALNQAQQRWDGVRAVREWVLMHARNQIINTFQLLKHARIEAHTAYLQRLPCYTVYQHYSGYPPLPAGQLNNLRAQIAQAEDIFKQGIDEDWRRSCLRYPEVLDYYFGLVRTSYPDDTHPSMRDPRFGAPGAQRRVKGPRGGSDDGNDNERRRERRPRNDGRTPPPRAPTPGYHRR